jgi:shikimate kinase
VPFRDSDDEIVKAANMTIAEIFARDGEPFFRLKESQVIARLLAGPPGVLSTGGGAFHGRGQPERDRPRGVSVWLRADLELLWQRVRHKIEPPAAAHRRTRGNAARPVESRAPVYALADLIVDSAARTCRSSDGRKVPRRWPPARRSGKEMPRMTDRGAGRPGARIL